MRRGLLLLMPAFAAGCATPEHAIPGTAAAGHTCNVDAIASFIGQPATNETGTAIMRATNAAVLRWARFGAMLTMDYRADRVTVRLSPDGRITAVSCG